MAPPDNLCQNDPNVNHLKFPTPGHVLLLGQRVGDDEFRQRALFDYFQRSSAQDAVCHDRIYALCPGLCELFGGEGEGAAGVRHVVYENRDLILYVADEDHARDLVGLFALLVEEGEIDSESICH